MYRMNDFCNRINTFGLLRTTKVFLKDIKSETICANYPLGYMFFVLPFLSFIPLAKNKKK